MNALRLVDTKNLPHNDWLEWRRRGIGGSEAAAVCSMSKWASPLEVYYDKLGELPPKDDTPKMKAGRMLEPVIRDWFAEETGMKVVRQHAILQSKEHPFMLANLDGWILKENAGLECKNTDYFNRHDWANENIPMAYKLQANHCMAVTGAERWYVAVLIDGWDFQWRLIERDEQLIQNLITVEHYFWHENVLKKVPPDVSAHDESLLNTMYPESKPTGIDITDYELVQRVIHTKALLEQAETAHDLAKNQVKFLMKDNELAYYQEELIFTWKKNSRARPFKIVGGND